MRSCRDDPTPFLRSAETTPRISESTPVPWIILLLAGLFEIAWAIGLKYTEGFTRPWPTFGTAAAMLVSLWLLGMAMKSLPVGTA